MFIRYHNEKSQPQIGVLIVSEQLNIYKYWKTILIRKFLTKVVINIVSTYSFMYSFIPFAIHKNKDHNH